MKQAVLFKHAVIIVHSSNAVLTIHQRSIPLEVAASEVLVGYLQVIKAYFANSRKSNLQTLVIFEQVAVYLELQLQLHGRTAVDYSDVKALIQQLGCLHDWAIGRSALFPLIQHRVFINGCF